eukprot:6184078-Amphidinium_carterae.1
MPPTLAIRWAYLDQAEYMFGSIGSSMMTLFTNGMLGDNLYQTMTAIKDASDCHPRKPHSKTLSRMI